nr:auxin-responsive protein SAUR50-like [Ipomoea batatas]GME07513.1 auxin-responsive protein SAUR50-like [Ipomoea batatas]GME14771.1 auxin-responsive protein SAUR50-like [Ipomoea batatas]GME21800.1 auxin-responsive protein SAUR50-like [Ipomoea batatas]
MIMAIKSSSRPNGNKKNGMKFKRVVEKLQKSFLLSKRSLVNHLDDFDVPNDVKEGHFAVRAVDDDNKVKRFIVPLSCLRNPCFLRLLEKAAEEYGFEHEGAIMLPCRPSELEKILGKQCNGRVYWSSTSQEI